MSLRWRLVAVFAVLGAVAIGLATTLAWVTTSRELHDQVDQFLLRRGGEVVDGRRSLPGLGSDAGIPGRPGPAGPPASFAPDVSTQVLDEDGRVTATSGADLPVGDEDLAVAAGGADRRLATVEVDGVSYRVLTAGLRDGGAVQLARDLTETEDVLDALAGRLLLITVAGAVMAGLVGWLVARRLTGPVRALADSAEQVAATQDLTVTIPVRGHDEVARLATSFNTMLSALADSRQRQAQLVQDASHELRTPLTSLRTSAELLERAEDLDPDERRRLLGVIASESRELSDLVGELVDLATQARSADHPFAPVALDELVATVVAQARDRTGRPIELSLPPGPVVVEGAEPLLERAVRNLVDNADKFSPPGTRLEVGLAVGDGVVLTVADHGPGIPAEDRERVFDRFHRSTATRTLPGSGLGLAIVADVAAGHGGSVAAEPREDGTSGAVLTLTLPTG